MEFGYLEIVTPDVDRVCATLAAASGVEFSDPVPELGHARTLRLPTGGRLGVRAPMRPDESPVVRPYVLVDDVAEAVEVARREGATIAMGATEIPGQGTFAIFIQGGIEFGLWQRE
ncbi:MAG: hydroxylase [Deltaproteobacteria bacterium]|nr:MAG: hydroxylase [Deltaproteobacteria bacterium]